MGERTCPLWFAALVVFALAGPLRADYLPAWTYSWTTTTPTLTSYTAPGTVTITPDPGTSAMPVGSTGLVAANISTITAIVDPVASTSIPASLRITPATNEGAYQLFLTIKDTASGLSHTFGFDGTLSGTFSAGSAMLNNEFGSGAQTYTLGSTAYTASMVSYLPPGPPGSSNLGALGAMVTVAAAGGGSGAISGFGTPEPASLLLFSLGAAGCAFAGWRRRRVPAASQAGL
jgi:hypothetical protein